MKNAKGGMYRTFEKGDSYNMTGHCLETYPIHETTPGKGYGQKISVYGDEKLRDEIVDFLNTHFVERRNAANKDRRKS